MKKVIIGIFTLVLVIVTVIPLRKTIDESIQIDGTFEDWVDMPKFNSDKYDKGRANLKDIKYYIDKDNLYLYFDKYYSDRKWNMVISITNDLEYETDENEDRFILMEDENNRSNILASYMINEEKKEVSFIENKFLENELEVKIPLEKLKKKSESIKVETFLGEEEYMDLEDFCSGEMIIANGPVFGSRGSMIFAIACFVFTGIVSFKYITLNKKNIIS